ncbi:hypothetical protein [Roseateles sp.]|uniref:hypothetical protein n=1 Tax=Roseateles sp. TaxID=1971397 RepID=UPI00393CB1BC
MSAPQDRKPTAPNWLRALLCMGVEKLALSGATRCEFKAHAGSDEEATYIASQHFDPAGQQFTVYVHHKATARFVCRSRPVVVDDFDEDVWNTDLSSHAFDPIPGRRPGLDGF